MSVDGEAQVMMNDRDLMSICADTSFTYDGRGRMVLTNEPRAPDRRPAPLLFLGRTIAGHVVRFGAAAPDAAVRQIQEIVDRQPPAGDLSAEPSALVAVRDALARHAPITAEGGGPCYRFPVSIARPARAIQLTPANVELARDTYPWLLDEIADWWPCFAVVCDGAAVSICFSSRLSASAAAAGVETIAAFRGRGYAAAVTAARGAAIRGSGRVPLYSTTWENRASQGVARRAGLVIFGVDSTWT